MAGSAKNFATLKIGTAKNGWKSNKIDEKVDKLRNMHGHFVSQNAYVFLCCLSGSLCLG